MVAILIILSLSFTILTPNISSENEKPRWNKGYSFDKQIILPIDTSKDQAEFQPVDIKVNFENPCWAKNENEHSLRLIYQKGGRFIEIESQIYNLNFTKNNFIDSCNIVFLVPEDADGSEKYYIYYDDQKKNNPDYKDHVDIEDSYYRYEPIRGFYFESWFYKIIQDECIQYAVSQKGKALNIPISQQVTKFKKDSKDFYPENTEHVSCFNFNIWINKGDKQTFLSTSQKLVSKEILVNGNLMLKFVIISESENGEIRSTNIYKYYYCPTEHKRIYVNVKHELVKELPDGDEIPASFGLMSNIEIKSPIDELNSGDIPPYLHFYSEKNRVVTYALDTNPENIEWQEIIGAEDDYDLGDFSWLSADHGEKGEAQAIIFDTNQVVKQGLDEYNGIQIGLLESNLVNLPNLNAKFSYIYLMRNRFEPDKGYNEKIPQDFAVEYNANFFSTRNGGYKQVEKEASMYKNLIDYQAEYEEEYKDNEKEKTTYSLKVYPYIPSSIYSKIYLSLFLFKRPYVYAELYHKNNLIAVGRVGWIKLNEDFRIDWKNTSLFSKVIFKNLEQGKYLVKICINNVLKKNNKEFVGYEIVDLNEDMSTIIECKREGYILLYFKDQNNNTIGDVETRIIEDDTIIESKKSTKEEETRIGLPCSFEKKYNLEIFYKGFLVEKDQIKLMDIRSIIPYKKEVEIDLYNLDIKLEKNNGFSSSFKPELYLKSPNMKEEKRIEPNEKSENNFRFVNLIPSDYLINLRYNSFRIEKPIEISENKSLSLDFYDLKVKILDKWNLTSEATLDVTLTSLDLKEEILLYGSKIDDQKYLFEELFPGTYNLKVAYKTIINNEIIEIPTDDNDITFNFQTLFNLSSKIYDIQGYPLANAEIVISRDNIRKIKKTDENGKSFFMVPPGKYKINISKDNELIAKKEVDVLSDKKLSIVTKEESRIQFIVLVACISMIFVLGLYSYKKRKTLFFIKILIVFIAISSIILPWWSLNTDDPNKIVENSSNMYLAPSYLIIFTSSDEMFYGEFASLDETFDFVINLIPILISLGVLFLFLNILFRNKYYKKLSSLFLILSLFMFIASLFTFFISMSNFSQVFIGSLIGSGDICVNDPGNNSCNFINGSWGLNSGFYLMVISTLILLFIFVYRLKTFLEKRLKVVYIKQ